LVHQDLAVVVCRAGHAGLSSPGDSLLYLIVDSTLKGKRGTKHPVAHTTRLSQHHPYVFGFRIVVLMVHWSVYCIPVDFAVVRRTGTSAYQSENALFCRTLRDFRPPTWCQEVIVVADAQLDVSAVAPERAGVSMGTTSGEPSEIERFDDHVV
jgi:hypothetical protein